MYGPSTAGRGRLVKRWNTPDGAAGASVLMRDGRCYMVVACLGSRSTGMSRLAAENESNFLRREVAKQVELVLAFDDAAS